MKTGKKIAVGLAAALAIAMFAAGAVSMVGALPMPVLANVVDGTDVSVEIGEGGLDFGNIIKGTPATLTGALQLTNNGEVLAKVEARFLPPHVEGVHGLVMDDSVIAASLFELGTTGHKVALADAGTDVDLTAVNYVPPGGGVISYDALLNVPGDQQVGLHTGLIELTFSAAA
jgi:hypothetical protein